jgi:hypothetical protein
MRVVTEYYSVQYATVDMAVFFFASIIYAIFSSKNGFSQDAFTALKYTNRQIV